MPTEPLAALAVTVHADMTALLRDIQRAPEMAARALSGQETQVNAALAKALSGGTKAVEAATSAQGRVAAQGARARVKTAQDGAQAETEARKKALDAQMGYEARHRTLSADAYKAYLGARQQDYKAYSAQWMRIGDTMLAAEKRQNAERDAARRTQAAAEKQRQRDETAFLKAHLAERRDAAKAAAAAEAAAMKRLDDARKTMRGEPTGTARQQARQVIGGAVTNAAVTVGGAALLGGFEAVKQAGAFQSTLLDLKSNTAVTPQNLELYKKAILSFANTYGADMKQTAMAFQRAENHFFSGQSAVKIVDAAVKMGTYAGSDTGQTANLLAQQMHSFNIAPSQAMNTAAIIHQAAVRGNLTAEELIQNAGYGINLAGAFSENPATVKGRPVGLDIKDALSMFSALTSHGFNPSEAATQVRDAIIHITAPTPQTLKRLDALKAATGRDLSGDFTMRGLQEKGLHGIMADIVAATPGHPEVALQLMGAQRGGVGAAVLAKDLAGASSDFRFTYGQLSDIQSGRMANPVTAGLPERVGSFDQQVKIFDNRMRTLGQTIGTTLMPPALRLLGWAQDLADAFTRWDKASGGKAGAGAVYGGAALGALGLGVKGRNWLRGAAGVGRAAAGAEGAIEGVAAGAGASKVERLLLGTANFFTRLAGLDLGAGALAILSRLGIIGAAAGGAGYLVKQDYDVYRETQGLTRRSAASDRSLTAGSDTRRRLDGQVIQNRTEADRLRTVIDGYKAEIGKIQAEGRRTGADGAPVIAEMTARMRKMEADREHLLADANRMTKDARRLSAPQSGEFGGVMPWVARSGDEMRARFGIRDIGGRASSGHIKDSDHYTGTALDFMVGKDRSKGNALASFMEQHALEEKVKYIIWQQHIWSPEKAAQGWRPMADRGSATANHMDHVHVSYLGAVGKATEGLHRFHAALAGAAAGGAGSPQSGDWFADYTRLSRGGGKEDRKAARIAFANREAQDRLAGDPTDRFSREKAALAAHLDALRRAGVSELTVEATRVQGLKRIHAEELADLQRHVAAKARLHGVHLRAALIQPLADMGGSIKAGLASARGIGASDLLPQQTQAQYDRAFNDALTGALGGATGSIKAGLGAARDIGSSDLLPQVTPAQVRTAAQGAKRDESFQNRLNQALLDSQVQFQKATGHVNRYDEVMARLNIDTKTLTDAQRQQLAAMLPQITKWDEATARVDRMKASVRQAADTMKGSLSNAFEGLLGKSKNPFGQVASDFSRMIRKMLADWAASRITDKVTGLLDGLIGRHAAPGAAGQGATLPGLSKGGGAMGAVGALAGLLPGPAGAVAGVLGGLLGGGAVPAVAGVPPGVAPVWVVGGSGVPGGGSSGGAGSLLGGIGMLGGLGSLLGGVGGLGGAAGALGGMASLPGMAGMGAGAGGAMSGLLSALGGGGAAGGLLGHAGLAGLFAHGGLLSGSGALGGLGAALPWVGGGLLLDKLLGDPLGKLFGGLFGGHGHKFLGLFAEGGTLPPNSWGIAGERGPEVIHTGSRPLTVVPNGGGPQSPAGPVMNFNIEHVHEASDGTSMARMMADVIKHRLRVSYA